jgi:CheY-like chemotaxis protein
MQNGSTILVVDDDDNLREAVSDALEDDGYTVVRAENGAVAIEALRRGPTPCLMVLDLMMPVLSGWEVLEIVRDDASLARMPIVVMSAMTAPAVDGWVSKPVNLTTLLATVRGFCPRPTPG